MDNNDKIEIIDDGVSENKKAESEELTHSTHSEHHHSHHGHHSHHSSHHSHGHSSSHRRRHSRKTKEIKRFFKKNKYQILNAVIAVLFIAILIILGFVIDKRGFFNNDPSSADTTDRFRETESSLQIEIPLFADDAVLVSTGVEKYINSVDIALARDYYKDYSALGRQDSGKPVTLWYEINGMPVDYSVKSTELLISEKDDFSSPIVYSVESDETSVDVYNLKTGTALN